MNMLNLDEETKSKLDTKWSERKWKYAMELIRSTCEAVQVEQINKTIFFDTVPYTVKYGYAWKNDGPSRTHSRMY